MAIDILGTVKSWMLETMADNTSTDEVKKFAKETLEGIQTLESEDVQKLLDFFAPAKS